MNDPLTHAYVHWLADVHLAGFAPAFTLSFHDSECSRKPPMPIASVVMGYGRKKRKADNYHIEKDKSQRDFDFNK